MYSPTMDRCVRAVWTTAVLLVTPVTTSTAFAQVTVGSLADALSDRDTLTVFPTGSGAYTLHQASSHDTRNGTPLGSQLGGAWGFKNVDFGNYIRRENNQGRQELVLFEQSGPGVITRWWSVGISSNLMNTGKFRIYLDGRSTPVLTRSGLNLVGGDNNGFGRSLNFGTPRLGGNLYGPIPYSSGIKVTWDGPTTHGRFANIAQYVAAGGTAHNVGNAVWYNINYRRYAPGTKVESYTGNATLVYDRELGNANGRLSSPVVHGPVGNTSVVRDQIVSNGSSLTRTFTAPGGARNGQAIREIKLSFNGSRTPNHRAALEGTFIELIFDGQRTARVPVGQFFGNGGSENDSNVYNDGSDYFRTISNGVMTCRWVMPYQNDARVRLINASGQAVNVDLDIKTGRYTWTGNSMHFHADYRAENDIRTRDVGNGNIPSRQRYSAEGDADFRFIDIRGRGVYVGDTMSIRNRNIGSSRSRDFWWGEGDEKIYIDYLNARGDGSSATPDQVGTGTEDYYGYSYGSDQLFTSPFVTQPIATGQRDASGNGLTVNGRVRGLDAIPFKRSLKFDMEIWKWRQGSVDVGAATFWYGVPGTASMQIAADLATDFERHTRRISSGASAQGIIDTAGDGKWTFFSAAASNRANSRVLTWGRVGNAGNAGFGGGENGAWNIPAISDRFIYVDGNRNIGIQNRPGNRELALHPAGNDPTRGNAVRELLVAQWQAGGSSAGLININGSIRNLIAQTGDSIDFRIFVDGVQRFSISNAGGTALPERYFDFDTPIRPGGSVDFVLGNGPGSDLYADESLLRATILSLGDTTNNVARVAGPTPAPLGLN